MTPFLFLRRYQHAWRGWQFCYHKEKSFRIQIVFVCMVFFAMLLFPLTNVERSLLLIVMGFVLVLELVNTAIEHLSDLLKPRMDEVVGRIKNIMAGSVLLASLVAVGIGILIFFPYLASFRKMF